MQGIKNVASVARSSIVHVNARLRIGHGTNQRAVHGRKKMLDDKKSTTNEKDGFKRVATFSSKYGPLCGSIAQHLFPSKSNRKGTIAILHLKDLPEHCISPRMEIESVGRVDIKDILKDFGMLQSVNQERKLVQDRGKDPNDVICVLISHPKTSIFMVVPFVFHDEKDPYKGSVGAAKTAIDQVL